LREELLSLAGGLAMRLLKIMFPMILICFSCTLFAMCNNGSTPVGPGDGGNGGDGHNNPPQALMSITPVERAYTQSQGVTFDASGSIDPDANIAAYEWDFHYDDTVFNTDMTGPTLTYSLPSFGSVVAALRVTDSGTPPLSSLIRKRLNVKPSGEITSVTDGKIDDFILRRAIDGFRGIYVLYTGTYEGVKGAYVQRSEDNGKTWGDPVIVSSLAEDAEPLGIWMDSAHLGIALAWMAADGTLVKYAYGEPDGDASISFSAPTTLDTLPHVVMHEAVLYSIACTGDWAYMVYMTSDAYELKLIQAKLDSSGAVTENNTFTVALDNDDRRKFSGANIARGPSGRGFLAYIWKSAGYDNADEAYLYYFTPPIGALEGPVRVDVGLTGFVYDHDPYVIVNNDDEPIVYMRTTGIYQGGRDIALCISDGNPPVFRTAIRGNNTIGEDKLAAQSSPCAVFDRGHDHLWLAFEDFRDNKTISQVYLAMFDSQYSTILPDFDISDDPAFIYSDVNPQICFSDVGKEKKSLVVLWERNGTDIVAYHAEY